MKINGADILSAYEGTIFDSNGKRIMSDVEYIVTTIIIDGKKNIIIRDVDSDYDSVVLMRLMYYFEVGFDEIIKTCKGINLSFNDIEFQIKEMISSLVKSEKYEEASKLKNEWDEYLKKNNK